MPSARRATKISKPATKISDLQPGHVQARRVRCGKANCRCARGLTHVAYYHVWRTDGVRYQRYVRRSEVASVRRACDEHRALQVELRKGRVIYRDALRGFRELLKGLDHADRS